MKCVYVCVCWGALYVFAHQSEWPRIFVILCRHCRRWRFCGACLGEYCELWISEYLLHVCCIFASQIQFNSIQFISTQIPSIFANVYKFWRMQLESLNFWDVKVRLSFPHLFLIIKLECFCCFHCPKKVSENIISNIKFQYRNTKLIFLRNK